MLSLDHGYLNELTLRTGPVLRAMARSAGRESRSRVRIIGYVARYDRGYADTRDGDYTIARSALRSATSADIPLLINHATDRVLASTSAGTLRVKDDTCGLFVEATFDGRDWPWLADELAKQQTFGSFGARASSSRWTRSKGRKVLTYGEVTEVTLIRPPEMPACVSTWLSLDTPRSRRTANEEVMAERWRIVERR